MMHRKIVDANGFRATRDLIRAARDERIARIDCEGLAVGLVRLHAAAGFGFDMRLVGRQSAVVVRTSDDIRDALRILGRDNGAVEFATPSKEAPRAALYGVLCEGKKIGHVMGEPGGFRLRKRGGVDGPLFATWPELRAKILAEYGQGRADARA